MGRSFFNLMVKGVSQQPLVRYLTERNIRTVVAPTHDGVTPVFPREYGDETLAPDVSRHFLCSVLFVHIHDDDILYYRLYIRGILSDAYDSYPGYFSVVPQDQMPGPKGGDADMLCSAFDAHASVEAVEAILRFPNWEMDNDSTKRYMSAQNRYGDLAKVLALPCRWDWDYYWASSANDTQDIATDT